MNKNALVVTLGSEPQVVTLTLHSLEKQSPSVKVDKIYVIHTSPSDKGVRKSLETLRIVFKEAPFNEYDINFVPVKDDGRQLSDLENTRAITAFFKTVFRLIKNLKERGYTIYLNASGGRKPMAIYSIVAAQILFDENDRAFYLISSKSLIKSKSLLPTHRTHWVKLIEIPILPWSEVDPVITAAAIHDDVLSSPEFWKALYRHKKKSLLTGFIYVKLSRSEREVLFEVIRRGGSSSEIAKKLGKSKKTVEHQLRSIYAKAKEWFNIPQNVKLNREFLIREFRDFI